MDLAELNSSSPVDGHLLQPSRTLLVGDNPLLASRLIASLGPRATQVAKVIVADIPVDFPFTSQTWPAELTDILSLLQSCLSDEQYRTFKRVSHARATHRLVLLRVPTCTYGYLSAWLSWRAVSSSLVDTRSFAIP